MAVTVGVFLLTSCGKDSGDKSTFSNEKTTFEWRGNTFLDEGCNPEDFGYNCPSNYTPITRSITDIYGCTFNVRMGIKECLFGSESHLIFKLIDIFPTNTNVPPCATWWSNLINLPQGQFVIEWNNLQDRLTAEFIELEMTAYTTGNPLSVDCAEGGYYISAFFKPICTKLCFNPNGGEVPGNGFYYSILCSTDGCCLDLGYYCLLPNGTVANVGGGKELLSPCSFFTEKDCKRYSQSVTFCNDNGCVE